MKEMHVTAARKSLLAKCVVQMDATIAPTATLWSAPVFLQLTCRKAHARVR